MRRTAKKPRPLSKQAQNYILRIYKDMPRNAYGTNGTLLRRMAKRMDADYWTLYKTGPFFLPEREVDRGYKKGGAE